MVDKVNGRVSAGEFLGRDLEFYTVTVTGVDIRALASGGSTASQARLDNLIEIVAMNGQPILLSNPTGSGPYVLKFAIEHKGAWADATALVTALETHGKNDQFQGAVAVSIADTL